MGNNIYAKIHCSKKGYFRRDETNVTTYVKDIRDATTFTQSKAYNVINNVVKPKERPTHTVVIINSTMEPIQNKETEVREQDINMSLNHNEILEDANDIMKAIDTLDEKLIKTGVNLSDLISQCDLERSDLLHYLENSKGYMKSSERDIIIKELTTIQRRRRKAKNAAELVNACYIPASQLEDAKGCKDEVEYNHSRLFYRPRTDVYERLGLENNFKQKT